MTPSVLDPGLNNPNFLIHPAPMLLNFAEVERRDGQLSIMNEGMTAGVLRCLDAMDAEKMAVCTALGLEAVDIDRLYIEGGADPSVYRSPGEPFNLSDRIWPRYLTEDVPYGSVMIASFARHLGVAAPISAGVSTLLSVATDTDFWAEGRTVERLGLAGMDAGEITGFCATGG
jgi:opine dehydrogenase